MSNCKRPEFAAEMEEDEVVGAIHESDETGENETADNANEDDTNERTVNSAAPLVNLEERVERINRLHERITASIKQSCDDTIETGTELAAIKDCLGRAWTRRFPTLGFNFKIRCAQNYMRLAKELPQGAFFKNVTKAYVALGML